MGSAFFILRRQNVSKKRTARVCSNCKKENIAMENIAMDGDGYDIVLCSRCNKEWQSIIELSSAVREMKAAIEEFRIVVNQST